MFGPLIQIQFSVFESRKWWGRVKIFLFGSCTQFLNSNTFIIQLILNLAKMRTTLDCFHLNSAWIQLLFKRPVAILQLFAQIDRWHKRK
jgi:hypothetical protein